MLAFSFFSSLVGMQSSEPEPSIPLTAPPEPIILTDRQPYSKDAWFAWLEPWGANGLVQGRDYTNAIRILPEQFPAGSVITWSWPSKPANGVYNFLAIDYGNAFNTLVQAPIPPRRVSDIAELSHSHSLRLDGRLPDFNVLIDFWLTKEAGNHDVHLFEIEVFLHASDAGSAYAAWASQLGVYTDAGGRVWRVSVDRTRVTPDILFLPSSDLVDGTVDLRAMLLWLVEAKVITGQEWFNGFGTGVEVVSADGSLTIDSLGVTYK